MASESSNASNEIGTIIAEVMQQISELADKASENMKDIDQSTQVVAVAQGTFKDLINSLDATSKSMQTMINMIGKIEDIANSVAAIAEEQAASSEEVLATVDMLAIAASDIADDSQKVNESANNVAESADSINSFVTSFKL